MKNSIEQLIGASVDRRALMKAGLGFLGLATVSCVQLPPNPFTPYDGILTPVANPTAIPKATFRSTLSQTDRAMLVGYIQDLEGILEQTVSQRFWSRSGLEEVTRASDTVVADFFNDMAKRKEDQVIWNIQLSSDNGVSRVDTDITINYGKFGGVSAIREAWVVASLADSGAPELVPFVNQETGQFFADEEKLKSAASTFFMLPVNLRWVPLLKEPRKNSEVVAMIGKFGSSSFSDPTVFLNIHTTGIAELHITSSPIAIDSSSQTK